MASSSPFIVSSSSFSRSTLPCPATSTAEAEVEMPTVCLSGGPNRPEVEPENEETMTPSSDSSSSFALSVLSQSSSSSIASSAALCVPSSVLPIEVAIVQTQYTGAPRRVPAVFFLTGMFGQEIKPHVKSSPSQSNLFLASDSSLPSFIPHSNVHPASAFSSSTSPTSSFSIGQHVSEMCGNWRNTASENNKPTSKPSPNGQATSLSSNAHLNNTARSKHVTQTLHQTKSQSKPSAIIHSNKPSAFATLTNTSESLSTSAFASNTSPVSKSSTPANEQPLHTSNLRSPSLRGSTSGMINTHELNALTSLSRIGKRAHSSAFMDEYVSPAPPFSLIDRIEPRAMESTTLPARKRPHCFTGANTDSGTVPWSKVILNRARTAADGLLDRMKLDDDGDEEDDIDRNIVKAEQKEDILSSPAPSSLYQVNEQRMEDTQLRCSTTVKTETVYDIGLRSSAFRTSSRRRF
ncbi:uncharacterized protein STEHIDRAFT_172973 [Stereum hirsutum FP-91666 SS1]|uniref:Uncharacterized protein n=1 Tax=Stereum hirsutum (strain FP-91666) TaxID=721885 RepID=R7RXD6_STEHR|nr:uncharacterized protein STEHIDRAFT_172973 [Stereum hirsutum FP-91666 SS1]EIM80041.1 hypothetical protein STEHIDRAFT_172973 [Stereum hirsutum FP-91666 SS1]